MKTDLFSVSKIFTERLLRIPDYQRGYAWTEKQLKDYWSDLIQLDPSKNHYIGVLTLEDVPNDVIEGWTEDHWIIRSKNYAPFYVVDGQQRLTTTIVLIQAITESIKDDVKLNFTSVDDIKRKYLFDSKDEGASRSYIFGYEKDNPSYEYLKTKIFLEKSASSYQAQETIYTHNLEFAKQYFIGKLAKLSVAKIEQLYTKITQNFLFSVRSETAYFPVARQKFRHSQSQRPLKTTVYNYSTYPFLPKSPENLELQTKLSLGIAPLNCSFAGGISGRLQSGEQRQIVGNHR